MSCQVGYLCRQVGSLCMEVVDSELRRHGQWREDLARRKRTASEAELQQARTTFSRLVRKQNQLLRGKDGLFNWKQCKMGIKIRFGERH